MDDEPYVWRSSRDRDADVLAVVGAALQSDYEAAVSVLESLDRESLVSLTWCLACWWAGAVAQADGVDASLAMVRRVALIIGSERERKDDDE